MSRKIFPVLLALSLVLTGCSFHFILPVPQNAGPTVSDQIDVPVPAGVSQPVDLSLRFGAGILNLKPGAQGLVTGTATYNVTDFKPTVTNTGASVKIEQGNWQLNGLPNVTNVKNEWDLELGTAPMNLKIDAGAYQAHYDLGGLALTNLTISDGAADVKLDFGSPNLAQMEMLTYSTGASQVSLTGLGNANFASLEFKSGAGDFTLDFSGALGRDGSVHVITGISNLTLVIPAGIPAQVTVKGGLSNVNHGSDWSVNSNVYTQQGSGPQLTIVVEIGAGNLTITQ
jgi:hypothetical protein